MQSSSTTQRIELTGGPTLVARIWPGEGLPVVFLHGLFSSSETWAGICARLDTPSVAFDLPGFGESDSSKLGLAARAEDIATAIRALGLERFELVGHSLGGAVAARVAELMPERVSSLLLLAPAGFGPLGTAFRSKGRAYDGPVTAVWGTRDRVVRPSHAHGVLRSFATAQVLLWDGIGHHPQAESREALLALIATGRAAPGCRRARRRLRRRFLPSFQPTRVRFA